MMARFISLAGVACAVALLVAMVPRPSAAGEAKIDYPHVIVCEFKGIRYFAYLDPHYTTLVRFGLIWRHGSIAVIGSVRNSLRI